MSKASKQASVSVITPSIGRQLWFWSSGAKRAAADSDSAVQPEAATVVYVWDDRTMNLTVLDAKGRARVVRSAQLVQPEDPWNESTGAHAQWMPYQVGQARAAT